MECCIHDTGTVLKMFFILNKNLAKANCTIKSGLHILWYSSSWLQHCFFVRPILKMATEYCNDFQSFTCYFAGNKDFFVRNKAILLKITATSTIFALFR